MPTVTTNKPYKCMTNTYEYTTYLIYNLMFPRFKQQAGMLHR